MDAAMWVRSTKVEHLRSSGEDREWSLMSTKVQHLRSCAGRFSVGVDVWCSRNFGSGLSVGRSMLNVRRFDRRLVVVLNECLDCLSRVICN